jgi:hypothetical protein
MRKRFALLWTPVVLGLALMLPATTAASSGYTYKTVYNYCDGYTAKLKMKDIAAGYTPANKLSIESWAQEKYGGSWHYVYTWNTAVYKFSANGSGHYLTTWRGYNGGANLARIVFRLRAWHGSSLLAQSTFHSVAC